MPDLRDQIRTYFDETSEPLTPDDAYHHWVGEGNVRPMSDSPVKWRIPTGVLVAVAAAAMAVLVVAVPLLVNRVTDSDPAAVPEPSTTPNTVATTIPDRSTSTTIRHAPTATSSVVPGIGRLTWQRIDGDNTTLPLSFAFEDGHYVAYEGGGTWTSPDAVTWTFEQNGPRDCQCLIRGQGYWGVGIIDDQRVVLHRAGDEWVPVDLPTVPVPDVNGIVWQPGNPEAIESGNRVMVSGTVYGQIPWDDIFGTDGTALWDSAAGSLQIGPFRGAWTEDTILGHVLMNVEGDEVQFIDQATGELLHTVRGAPDFPAARIVEQMKSVGFLWYRTTFVSGYERISWTPANLPQELAFHAGDFLPLSSGGFAAFVNEYAQGDPDLNPPLVGATVWTSADGVSWKDHGDPPFAVEGATDLTVEPFGDRLIATVVTGWDENGAPLGDSPTYVSGNGLDWERIDRPPVFYVRWETNFGSVLLDGTQTRTVFWVSTGRASGWTELEDAPGERKVLTSVASPGAAGDVLFIGGETELRNARTLWIGRFVP